MGAKLETNARARGAKLTAEPNVIPFIDVLLVLLIIFMVTAPSPTVDLRIDLPPPRPVPMPDLNRATIVALRETGGGFELAVDDQVVSEAALRDAVLQHARANNPALAFNDLYSDARIFVRADQATAYSNVVRVIDGLEHDGFVNVGIFAEKVQDS
ncbi:MAG: biopolymer transporter ExbD [Pseudomonadota bacterium]